jgi:hypothetical protein
MAWRALYMLTVLCAQKSRNQGSALIEFDVVSISSDNVDADDDVDGARVSRKQVVVHARDVGKSKRKLVPVTVVKWECVRVVLTFDTAAAGLATRADDSRRCARHQTRASACACCCA